MAMLEPSYLIFLLQQGLDAILNGQYAEGVTFLGQARTQLPLDQVQFGAALDVFIEGHTDYQHVQRTLQEASIRFAEAYTRQRAQLATLETLLPQLIRNLEIDSSLLQQSNGPSLRDGSFSSDEERQPPELVVTCFRRFEVKRRGKPILLCANSKGQSILRYLVATSGHRASSDALQALFWPEDEAEVAQRKLHSAISALRHCLSEGSSRSAGGYIICKNHTYSLNPAVTLQTDIGDFLSYYRRGQQRSEERVTCYEKACHLYTGPFLPEDIYADWSSLQREELRHIYFTMCDALADHHFQAKNYEDAITWSTAMLKENQCDEIAHRHLIRIYAAQGRRHEALQQYQRCEHILHQELRVQPLPETQMLLQHLLANEGLGVGKQAQ